LQQWVLSKKSPREIEKVFKMLDYKSEQDELLST